ncbi:MAG: PAS domain-containing protein [Alphaproteobacteria bacterium]|nr:PAS domain-containing protein [Alphaproteobacteria bacterium]
MSRPGIAPTGIERTFPENNVIVSKTDARGIITYANQTFLDVARYDLKEVIGKPHNMIRHPAMPRSVFKFLWDRIASGFEVFAYVVNLAKDGDHYWVFAHVTPTFDAAGNVIGYHSNRRLPRRDAIQAIEPVYRILLERERQESSPKRGLETGTETLHAFLKSKDADYDRFVLGI